VTPPSLEGIRVLVLTSGHEVLDGRVHAREARSLQRLGADITIVGQWTRGDLDEVRVLPVSPDRSRLSRFLWKPWRCLWAARRENPDIVHFHDAEMLATLPLARLLWPGARFVYDVHEDFGNLMMIRDWFPAPLKPAVRTLTNLGERTLARLAHGIVAVTPPLQRKFPALRGTVAYNFSTAEFFEEADAHARASSERRFDLVHLGTLSRRRAEFLAEVLREFHGRRPKARSLVLGADERVFEGISLPEGCELKGKVPFASVPDYLGDAKVGIDVHPWLTPHLLPALAVKVCEYMASGCAVVASAMPVLDEVLRDSNLVPESVFRIEGGTPLDYAEGVIRMLKKIDSGADPGGRNRAFASKNMTWSREADKIACLYLELLGRKPCAN
jgi:glycosyltransferase involved in cell wall biosynthesis